MQERNGEANTSRNDNMITFYTGSYQDNNIMLLNNEFGSREAALFISNLEQLEDFNFEMWLCTMRNTVAHRQH